MHKLIPISIKKVSFELVYIIIMTQILKVLHIFFMNNGKLNIIVVHIFLVFLFETVMFPIIKDAKLMYLLYFRF